MSDWSSDVCSSDLVSHEPLFRLMVLATLSCSQPRGQADGRARSQSLPALTRLPEHLSPGTAALPASAAACARSALNARTALHRLFGERAKKSHLQRKRDNQTSHDKTSHHRDDPDTTTTPPGHPSP